MNINIKDDLSNYAEECLNILYENGFVSQVNKYTRVTAHSRTCIGHIFAGTEVENEKNISPSVIKTNISDHYATSIEIRDNETKLATPTEELTIQKLTRSSKTNHG
ncbi:hypothetical protein JTB14_006338 [Gonioctena quinquepunctata]|nr:hypothetical protein JTB14_006338 [Gonioctena quinquepunctata]